MASISDPFVGPPVEERPLAKAPLEWVIVQVRYPLVLAVDRSESIASFQAEIRDRYPILNEERGVTLSSTPQQIPPHMIWRFADAEGKWRVSLTRGFMALETTSYTSRKDFVARFREVLGALQKHVAPNRIDRLGLRYIDRIRRTEMEDLGSLVRPEMRGITSSEIAARCTHSLTETVFELEDARLLARWGMLPPDATIDAGMEPVAEQSWVLDLDMASTKPQALDVDEVAERARRFAEQIYQFFRWAVTEEFLTRFGGSDVRKSHA